MARAEHLRCQEQLTVLDNPSDAEPSQQCDYRESLARMLAVSAQGNCEVRFYDEAYDYESIRGVFRTLRENEGAMQKMVIGIIEYVADSFGGERERDQRARMTAESLLGVRLPQQPGRLCSLSKLMRILESIQNKLCMRCHWQIIGWVV